MNVVRWCRRSSAAPIDGVLRAPEGDKMDIEKFTERSKGFIQAAQGLAQRRGHQRLMPEHLLKVLLDDEEGLAANLIRATGGQPEVALSGVDAALDKLPRVDGAGAGQVFVGPELARVLDNAEEQA